MKQDHDQTKGAGPTSPDDDDNPAGRARVRDLLIRRLEADGLVRPRGATVADHELFLQRLVDRLSYLPERDLTVLAECVLRRAGGKLFNEWPAFATIWNLAQTLCRTPEPDERRHIMTTWLRSRGGPIAREGGYLVELWRYLRAFGSPPGPAALEALRRDADDNRRTRARLNALRDRGAASAADLEWLEYYARAEAYCLALVAAGEEARAARGEAA